MQNALRFVMKNKSFSSLINNFKRIKTYLSKRKNFYFSSKIWGRFAFTFCRYFHQNLQVLPSESVAGDTLRFGGKFQYIFQTKFFPLEFEGISYNSVCYVKNLKTMLFQTSFFKPMPPAKFWNIFWILFGRKLWISPFVHCTCSLYVVSYYSKYTAEIDCSRDNIEQNYSIESKD